MTNIEILRKIVSENKNGYSNILKRKYPDIVSWINDSTPLLEDESFTLKTKIYWILNGLKTFPICKYCEKEIRKNIESISIGYHDTCSVKCAGNMKDRIEKIKNTCLEKYGVTNYRKTEECESKSRKTCLEKYGVEHSFQSDNNKKKTKNTCMERYGVVNPMKCKSVLEKQNMTCLERYGVDNVFKSDEMKNRIQKTNIIRYGTNHPMQSDTLKMKMSESSRLRTLEKSWTNNILGDMYSIPCFDKKYFLDNYNRDFEFEFRCNTCGSKFKSKHYDGIHRRCEHCFPNTSSVGEVEIHEFISSISKCDVIRNTKDVISPHEIDIYIPSKKLAFEFDGLYWHSFQILKSKNKNIDKFYHLNKTERCYDMGIRLIHIFEDEWNLKREIVKDRISDMFGIYNRTIFARKCDVRLINRDEYFDFLENNHLQGGINSSIALGLYMNNELVSIMTFGKRRIALGSKSPSCDDYELLRFCSLKGCHVVGSAGKLLKHFERRYNPKSIISYADRRWSEGKLYKALGFEYVHTSPPNYWYMERQCIRRLHRFNFMKGKLKNILKSYDESLSEKQNMENNGYKYIYDCGNILFKKEY